MDQKQKMWKLGVWDCRADGVLYGSAERGEEGPGAGGKREWSRLTSHRAPLRSGVFVLLGRIRQGHQMASVGNTPDDRDDRCQGPASREERRTWPRIRRGGCAG